MTTRDVTGKFISNITFNEMFFDKIDSEHKAYWLGFLFADGCITDRGVLQLALSDKDKEHVLQFTSALQSNANLYQWQKGLHAYCAVHHRSKHMMESLQNYGFIPRKTKILRLPCLEWNLQSHFCRGYFDGDGSVFESHSKRNQHTYAKLCMNMIGNIEFITELQDVLISHLGINKTKLNIPKHSQEMAYMIYSGTPQVQRIANWMYQDATIWLNRKREKFRIDEQS